MAVKIVFAQSGFFLSELEYSREISDLWSKYCVAKNKNTLFGRTNHLMRKMMHTSPRGSVLRRVTHREAAKYAE